jgi:ketosteroid isomerase-like protein
MNSDEEEVMRVEREWTEAHRVVDVATLDRLMADDFVRINSDGSKVRRAEALASYANGQKTWDLAAGAEYDVRVYGEVALVFVRWSARGNSHGQPFDYTARILSVYHRRNHRWQMVAEQSTALPAEQT